MARLRDPALAARGGRQDLENRNSAPAANNLSCKGIPICREKHMRRRQNVLERGRGNCDNSRPRFLLLVARGGHNDMLYRTWGPWPFRLASKRAMTICNHDYSGIHVNIVFYRHFGGIWGHASLKMAMKVKNDPKINLFFFSMPLYFPKVPCELNHTDG